MYMPGIGGNAFAVTAVLFAAAIPAAIPTSAATVINVTVPNLALFSLGSVPDVAAQYNHDYSYQGITINGNNLLLAVGDATNATQNIFALPLIRNNNHI